MRKSGKYRFSLQFSAETEEQIQAGELLEQLGNRESAVVAAALGEYLVAYPALTSPECKVEIKAVQNLSLEQLKNMVQKMLDERLNNFSKSSSGKNNTIKSHGSITEMLDNLDVFQ